MVPSTLQVKVCQMDDDPNFYEWANEKLKSELREEWEPIPLYLELELPCESPEPSVENREDDKAVIIQL